MSQIKKLQAESQAKLKNTEETLTKKMKETTELVQQTTVKKMTEEEHNMVQKVRKEKDSEKDIIMA